jgi:hypothetical protein
MKDGAWMRELLNTFERLSHSQWWFWGSFIIPMIIANAGAIYLAIKFEDKQTEIDNLKSDLKACRQ